MMSNHDLLAADVDDDTAGFGKSATLLLASLLRICVEGACGR